MSWGLTALPSGPQRRIMVYGCVNVGFRVYSWKCPVGGASLWGLMGIGEMIKFSGQALRAGAEVGTGVGRVRAALAASLRSFR